MNTYNISLNERVVLKNVPEGNLEMRKEQIADILWMGSKSPSNKEDIKNSLSISLNTEPLQLFD